MPGAIDLTGQKFSRLTVIRRATNNPRGEARWECVCECGSGKTIIAISGNLKNQHTRSCGCLTKEAKTTHGLRHTPEYRVWDNIKRRCYSEKHKSYSDYGARGITMCDEWKESFEAFYRDMGPRPTQQHTIDRRENDKGYSKENCRWTTWEEQANNRRNNIYYELDGKTKTLAEWCRDLSLPYSAIYTRMKRGANFEDAIADFVCS